MEGSNSVHDTGIIKSETIALGVWFSFRQQMVGLVGLAKSLG